MFATCLFKPHGWSLTKVFKDVVMLYIYIYLWHAAADYCYHEHENVRVSARKRESNQNTNVIQCFFLKVRSCRGWKPFVFNCWSFSMPSWPMAISVTFQGAGLWGTSVLRHDEQLVYEQLDFSPSTFGLLSSLRDNQDRSSSWRMINY